MSSKCLAIHISSSRIIIFKKVNDQPVIYQICGKDSFPTHIYLKNQVLTGPISDLSEIDRVYYFESPFSLIGRNYNEPYVKSQRENTRHHFFEGENGEVMVEVMENNEPVLKSPTEILTILLKSLFEKAEINLSEYPYVLFSYPSSFKEAQLCEFKKCVESLGIPHADYVQESISISNYYGLSRVDSQQSWIVASLGSNSLRLATVSNNLQETNNKMISTMGGVTITENIMAEVNDYYLEKGISISQPRLFEEAEKCKHAFYSDDSYTFSFDGYEFCLTKSRFDSLSQSTNEKIIEEIDNYINCDSQTPFALLLSGKGFLLRSLLAKIEEYCKSKSIILKNGIGFNDYVGLGMVNCFAEFVQRYPETDILPQTAFSMSRSIYNPPNNTNIRDIYIIDPDSVNNTLPPLGERTSEVNANPGNPIPIETPIYEMEISESSYVEQLMKLREKQYQQHYDNINTSLAENSRQKASIFVSKQETEILKKLIIHRLKNNGNYDTLLSLYYSMVKDNLQDIHNCQNEESNIEVSTGITHKEQVSEVFCNLFQKLQTCSILDIAVVIAYFILGISIIYGIKKVFE